MYICRLNSHFNVSFYDTKKVTWKSLFSFLNSNINHKNEKEKNTYLIKKN